MPAVEIIDPMGYPAYWTLIGVALLLAIPAWYFWVIWSTREKKDGSTPTTTPARRPSSTMPGSMDPWDSVRRVYLAQLDQIKERHEAGELDERGVHLEIRRVMRDYTKARTGIDAATFTSSDAAQLSLTAPLAKTLKQLSFPSFARGSTAKPERSLFRARQVVQKW